MIWCLYITTCELSFVANFYCDKTKNKKYHDMFMKSSAYRRPAVLEGEGVRK